MARAFETYWPLTRDLLKPGDTVLLEHGDTWYVSPDEREGLISDAYNIVEGITLGAYGEGARPVIRGDIPEANDPAFWTLYHDENGVKIWAFANKLQDSNVIVFNSGLCNSDFFGIEQLHGTLIRCGTCGNGDNVIIVL